MERKHKRMALIAGILAASVGGMAALSSLKPEPPKKEVENFDLLVDVVELEVSTASFEIKSQGTVRPRTQTTVSAEVSGSIVDICSE